MSSIAHLFVAGGFVMYPLVIFLLFALMIGIERIILYRKFTKDLRRFNKVLEKNQSWVMLPSVLERDTEELGSLFARAMRSAKNYNGLENRLQDVVSYADERLKRGLSWLSMIVTMAIGSIGDRAWHDSRLCCRRWRYWCAYHHYRRCIRSLGSNSDRPYSSNNCAWLSQLLCSKGKRFYYYLRA